jgi:hypothetical protein
MTADGGPVLQPVLSGSEGAERAFATWATDLETLVQRLAEECERGQITQGTADELRSLVASAHQLTSQR